MTRVEGDYSLGVPRLQHTLGKLRTQQEQVESFRNAARHLTPVGHFVIEMWVPGIRRFLPGQTAVPFEVSARHIGPSFRHMRVGRPPSAEAAYTVRCATMAP